MSQDRNPFGGLNSKGLYVPMSDDEREVIQRLIEADDLEVVIHGWCTLHQPQIRSAGDKRLSIGIDLTFNRYDTIFYLDLELRTRAGISLFREKQPTLVDGAPLQTSPGFSVQMIWDFSIHYMDPKLVKALKPGAVGLTSRRLDRDTGAATLTGNMKLTEEQKRLIHLLDQGEKVAKKIDRERLHEAMRKAKEQ